MTQLIINSVPSGAQVQIDGKIIGTTPLTHIIDDICLAEFRAECLSGGSVVCSWDVLKIRLEDQTVSRLWWNLTRDERYSIAESAINGVAFGDIRWSCSGSPMCAGPDDDWKNACCVHDTMIRYLKFVSGTVLGADSCYQKYREDREVFCYVPDTAYNLPGAMVSCITPYGPGYGHSMCAIQINEDQTQLSNWVVFQYSDFDIKPGHWQMPTHLWDDLILKMKTLDEVLPGCGGTEATEIVRWNLDDI